jgi:N-acetylneuraminic acid mutarotase
MNYRLSIILIVISVQLQGKNSKTVSCSVTGSIPVTENNQGYGVSSASVGILNDKLILIGGSNFSKTYPWDGGKKVFLDDILIAEKKNDNSLVCLKHPCRFPVNISNTITIGDSTSLYILGGFNNTEVNKKVFRIYFDNSDSLAIEATSYLPEHFTPTAGVYYNQLMYISGHDEKQNLLYTFNPASGYWNKFTGIPGDIRSEAIITLLHEQADSSKLYIFGGRHINKDKLIIYTDFWSYSPNKQAWKREGTMGVPGLKPLVIMAAPAIANSEGEFYFFGGDEGIRLKKRFELEKEIARSRGKKKEIYKKKLRRQFTKHTGFPNTIIRYNINRNTWEIAGKTHNRNLPVATTALWWRNKIILPAGELRPGIRSKNILEIDLNL